MDEAKNSYTILILDDEEGIRSQLKWALKDQYEVLEAEDASAALDLVRKHKPDLATIDIALSSVGEDTKGIDFLVDALAVHPEMKAIMVTGNEEKETALEAIAAGAHDYFQKPVDLNELKVIIKRALYIRRLEAENRDLQMRLTEEKSYDKIIGQSPEIVDVFKKIETIAASEYTVLLTGESGTGKELVAKAIHSKSPRNDMPFVTINCGAIPENLLESELFGHEKGAFTDAVALKKGKIERANGGTLLLDEIGELPLLLQVKLLRFLQEQTFERVGGTDQIKVDTRIIAATNKDIEAEVRRKEFREDLFYRLSVINIELPPLRNRGDDIMLLASHFLEKFAAENKKVGYSFDKSAVSRILTHNWPGNVRELENRIKRAVILSEERRIRPSALGFEAEEGDRGGTLAEVRERVETEHIQSALNRTGWNVSRAAAELGVSRTTLYDLMDKYGIKRD